MTEPRPEIRLHHHDVGPIRHITASGSDRFDHAEIRLRFHHGTGAAKALMVLARVAIEVLVEARKFRPVEGLLDRVQEGRRWND